MCKKSSSGRCSDWVVISPGQRPIPIERAKGTGKDAGSALFNPILSADPGGAFPSETAVLLFSSFHIQRRQEAGVYSDVERRGRRGEGGPFSPKEGVGYGRTSGTDGANDRADNNRLQPLRRRGGEI